MSQQFIYQMHRLTKRLPNGVELLKDISLSFYPGAKIGVIGANGSGKTTLIRIMAGIDDDYQGDTWIEPNAKVGFLPQEPTLDASLTVKENIELSVSSTRKLLDDYEAVTARFSEPLTDEEMDQVITRQGELQDKIDATNAWELDRTLDIAMDALRVPPGESSVSTLSGGELRRVALCKLLLAQPDLLLLDEPTNHLDAESVAWLERALREYPGTVMCITHDRYFLDNVTRWILELDHGQGIPWEANYTTWLEQKQKRMEEKAKSDTQTRKLLEREAAWAGTSQKARQARNKARLDRYEDLAQSTYETDADRENQLDILIPHGPRLGSVVIEARNLSKAYGDKLLFEDLSFDLPRGGIVGIIGANGAGKTTLFRMLTGQETPDSGTLNIGETVEISHVDQFRDTLRGDVSVFENITKGTDIIKAGTREMKSRAYVSAFGFKSAKQQQKVGTLSGGERNRVQLAMLLQTGGNLLLLDEPSNDLDVNTLRSLEESLLNFLGCVMVISHDRWFLDRIATHILAFEGDSKVVYFQGNHEEYEQDRRRRLGEAADQPTRIRYKPLRRE